MEPAGNHPYSGQTPPSSPSSSPPSSPTSTRLQSKIDGIRPAPLGVPTISPILNWSDTRMITHGDSVGYRTPNGIQHINGQVQLFHSGQNSQGLIYNEGQVAGASVTTSISNNERRTTTHVGYNKNRFDQEGKDFAVQETRIQGNRVNYEGGHLIDYKFSAGNSHTTVDNYFPQHHIVNSPLKEYVIKRSDEYVEIILFTEDPPTVAKTKHRKGEEQKIPIGDILVQINQGRITNAYYFPNNYFDYQRLKDYHSNVAPVSEALLPYFRLKPCFHALLQAAIITECRNNPQGKALQTSLEHHFEGVMDQLSDGMAMTACDSHERELIALASKVLHEDGHVAPFLLLNCNQTMMQIMGNQPLALPHKILGEFLIKYALRNALKSEVISINSRLMFLNVIIDFISNSTEVSSEAIDYVDSLASEFKRAFEELEMIAHTMTQQEHFYYADTLRSLCSKWNHRFFNEAHPVCFMDLDVVLYKFVVVLGEIAQKYPIISLEGDFAHSFLYMAKEAQDTVDYWLDTGTPDEALERELTILSGIRNDCLALFDRLPYDEKTVPIFQSNVKNFVISRRSEGFARLVLENLGVGNESDSSELEDSVITDSWEESDSYDSQNSAEIYEDIDSYETEESESSDVFKNFLSDVSEDLESSEMSGSSSETE